MPKLVQPAFPGPSLPEPDEGLALLTAFHRVLDPMVRQQIVALVTALAQDGGSGGLSPASGTMHGREMPIGRGSLSA